MSAARKNLTLVWMVMFAIMSVTGSTVAFAQKSGGGVTGEARLHPGTWGNQRSSRSIQHARNYSSDMYDYSRGAQRVEPSVAKSQSEELGHNITKAQKEMATARQEVGNDTAALARLKAVEQHLAAAAEHHKMLHEECCKDAVDGGVCMKHCSDITAELDKAQAEQDAVIRALEMKSRESASKAPSTHHK